MENYRNINWINWQLLDLDSSAPMNANKWGAGECIWKLVLRSFICYRLKCQKAHYKQVWSYITLLSMRQTHNIENRIETLLQYVYSFACCTNLSYFRPGQEMKRETIRAGRTLSAFTQIIQTNNANCIAELLQQHCNGSRMSKQKSIMT